MTTIEQLEKHFKIRRNASSIMIKENNAEIFTEEQLKESCNIVLLRLKRGIENLLLKFLQKAQIMMCIRNVSKRILLNMLLKTSLYVRIYMKWKM